jgi:ribosome maturation factor RimP
MPPARTSHAREHLLEMLAPVVAATGHDLEDITVTTAGRRSLVRVVVDADGGVDLDAVADVSRAVSDALDDESGDGAAFAGPYVLEVTSPGVDRPLTEQRHWRRAIGRLVQVPVGDRTVTGRVVETGTTGATLDVDGTAEAFGWDELGTGRVQVEFNRPRSGDDTGGEEE